MTVLVTGGAGYIGSHTVHALVDAGERVVCARQPLHRLRHRPARADAADRRAASANQTLVAELIEDHDVEAIIHFAGSTIVPDSIKDPLGYYGNNTANSRALIEAAVRGGVRHFIFPRPRRCTAIRPACRSARTIRPCRCRPMAGRS